MSQHGGDHVDREVVEAILGLPGEEWTPGEIRTIIYSLATVHLKAVLTIGKLELGGIEEAEEAFQEFCAKKLQHGFPRFDPKKGKGLRYVMEGWRLHLRTCDRRKKKRATCEHQVAVDEKGKAIVEAIDGAPPVELPLDVKHALKSLTDDEQRVVRDRIQGYRHEEIAARIGKTGAAVRQIYFRAKKKVGRLLADYDEGTDTTVNTAGTLEGNSSGSDDDTAKGRNTDNAKTEDSP